MSKSVCRSWGNSPPPRKRFGQHFLTDPGVVQRILQIVRPGPEEHLVEIGPGLGALTGPLLQKAGILDTVEIDGDVIPRLRSRCRGFGELTVFNADALTFDFASLHDERGLLRIVGNLPYNISTPLLFHLLDQADHILDMHFMLQKEVVDRMAAGPGQCAYGRLSVMLQYRCRVEALFSVGARAFSPPPRVDSAFVRLLPYTELPLKAADEKRFMALVRQAFTQRRKTLRNSLRQLLSAAQIEAAGVDPGARPEVLALADFVALSDRME